MSPFDASLARWEPCCSQLWHGVGRFLTDNVLKEGARFRVANKGWDILVSALVWCCVMFVVSPQTVHDQ